MEHALFVGARDLLDQVAWPATTVCQIEGPCLRVRLNEWKGLPLLEAVEPHGIEVPRLNLVCSI